MESTDRTHRYRTIWISDLHLGTRGCKAEFLLDFLRATSCERLYLVGDIIDGWRLRKSPYWNQSQSKVVQSIMRKARHGTEVVYVPGNHDEALRGYVGLMFGGVLVRREVVHSTADGKRLLVCHGDQFDGVVQYHRWLALLGDRAYNFCLQLNHWFNVGRRRLGMRYWSLSAFLKHKVKNAVDFICRFEQSLADEAKRRGLDGVVAGHIHHAEMREIDGVLYCNDGDWVESCTALVEHHDGTLEILDWPQLRGEDLLGLGVDDDVDSNQPELPFETAADERA
ncbi:MAG: UDP-2,3-diacylglucosamine diphosphatase [Planctomycetota bacterium]